MLSDQVFPGKMKTRKNLMETFKQYRPCNGSKSKYMIVVIPAQLNCLTRVCVWMTLDSC